MAEIKQTERAARVLKDTMDCCKDYRHEFVMPEHLLLVLADEFCFDRTLNIFYPIESFVERLEERLEDVETVPEGTDYEPETSIQMEQVIDHGTGPATPRDGHFTVERVVGVLSAERRARRQGEQLHERAD